MSGVCVVIPALDCAGTVGEVVRGVRAAAPGLPVAVVDDGSSDGTAAAARDAGAHVLRHARRMGKGAALATGFGWALGRGADGVATLDGDGQHDPAELPALLAAHGRAPAALVIGARGLHDTASPMPALNRVGNRVSTYWITLFAGRPISDSQSGFRVYPRRLIAPPPRSTGFETESELVLRAAKLGLPIMCVPVRTVYAPRGSRRTHFRPARDTARIVSLVLRQLRWRA
ncbi:MAG TPA: glycosyltransferase family 2 protein [Polyangia bacterium]|jgi:glycosyltransferase involved in cell wall biosynthesis